MISPNLNAVLKPATQKQTEQDEKGFPSHLSSWTHSGNKNSRVVVDCELSVASCTTSWETDSILQLLTACSVSSVIRTAPPLSGLATGDYWCKELSIPKIASSQWHAFCFPSSPSLGRWVVPDSLPPLQLSCSPLDSYSSFLWNERSSFFFIYPSLDSFYSCNREYLFHLEYELTTFR